MPAIIIEQALLDNLSRRSAKNILSASAIAIENVTIMHGAQKDRAGAPYIRHLMIVAQNAANILAKHPLLGSSYQQALSEQAFLVGCYHDSLEDIRVRRNDESTTNLNHDDLAGLKVSKETALTIDLLTKPEHGDEKPQPASGPSDAWATYKNQILHLIDPPEGIYSDRTLLLRHIIATACKIADNQHNADINRLPEWVRNKQSTLNGAAKYAISAATLNLTLTRLIEHLNTLEQP